MAKCEHGRNDDTCTLCGKTTVLDRVIAFLDSQPHYTSTGAYRREDLIYGVRAILCSTLEPQNGCGPDAALRGRIVALACAMEEDAHDLEATLGTKELTAQRRRAAVSVREWSRAVRALLTKG